MTIAIHLLEEAKQRTEERLGSYKRVMGLWGKTWQERVDEDLPEDQYILLELKQMEFHIKEFQSAIEKLKAA